MCRRCVVVVSKCCLLALSLRFVFVVLYVCFMCGVFCMLLCAVVVFVLFCCCYCVSCVLFSSLCVLLVFA